MAGDNVEVEIDIVRERFARFARDDAPGRSALYEQWAAGVADDAEIAGVLARIPRTRRQPPLVFAVARALGAPEADYPHFAAWVSDHAQALVAEASSRSLQTNEPGRCAPLVAALSGVEGPIALLEIGASAGICLYPDRFGYDFSDGTRLDGLGDAPTADAAVLHCDLLGTTIAHLRQPEIVWRAGIDLVPLDASDPGDRAFLTGLAWPGERGRADRIRAGLDIVREDPPLLVAGDAADAAVLESVAALAPTGATLVVTTPGVLVHIPRDARESLISHIRSMDAVWVTLDPPGLHAAWRPPVEGSQWAGFVLARDARPIADCDPLGAWMEWRG